MQAREESQTTDSYRPIVREDLIRFHLADMERNLRDVKLKLQASGDSFLATEAWIAHCKEEIALLEYMAEKLRELLPHA